MVKLFDHMLYFLLWNEVIRFRRKYKYNKLVIYKTLNANIFYLAFYLHCKQPNLWKQSIDVQAV